MIVRRSHCVAPTAPKTNAPSERGVIASATRERIPASQFCYRSEINGLYDFRRFSRPSFIPAPKTSLIMPLPARGNGCAPDIRAGGRRVGRATVARLGDEPPGPALEPRCRVLPVARKPRDGRRRRLREACLTGGREVARKYKDERTERPPVFPTLTIARCESRRGDGRAWPFSAAGRARDRGPPAHPAPSRRPASERRERRLVATMELAHSAEGRKPDRASRLMARPRGGPWGAEAAVRPVSERTMKHVRR